jgi:hypothetical protein
MLAALERLGQYTSRRERFCKTLHYPPGYPLDPFHQKRRFIKKIEKLGRRVSQFRQCLFVSESRHIGRRVCIAFALALITVALIAIGLIAIALFAVGYVGHVRHVGRVRHIGQVGIRIYVDAPVIHRIPVRVHVPVRVMRVGRRRWNGLCVDGRSVGGSGSQDGCNAGQKYQSQKYRSHPDPP